MDYITGLTKILYWPVIGSAGYIYNTAGHIVHCVTPARQNIEIRMWKLAAEAGPYVKIAALSGAAAVGLGAYGSHRNYAKINDVDLRQVFETANRYHFIHTLAMLGLPFCRRPYVGAVFFVSGMVLFSGTCYYHAFTGDKRYRRCTPVGGVCLIVAWLSMCL